MKDYNGRCDYQYEMARGRASEMGGRKRQSGHDDAGPSTAPHRIGAFTTLQIGTHHMSYMRKHDGDDERTMFLVNIPTDTTERHIREIFQSVGTIESVRLWKSAAAMAREGKDQEDASQSTRKDAAVASSEAEPTIIPLPPLDPRHPHSLLPTATSAHITFLDESSLQRALALTRIKTWPDPFKRIEDARSRMALQEEDAPGKERKALTAEDAVAAANEVQGSTSAPELGLAFLLARHKALRPPLSAVRAHADSVIANFAWQKAHPSKQAKGKGGIEAVSVGPDGELLDSDGFVIVQGTGKYGRAVDSRQGGAGGVRIARKAVPTLGEKEQDQQPSKKKKRLELDDFYRFQRREAKRQELADLRAKFQADQEKVKKLKAGRSFKPF